jgi:hypothetical protein
MLAQESAFGPNSTSAALSTPETNRGCANEPDKKVLYEEELRNNIPSEFTPTGQSVGILSQVTIVVNHGKTCAETKKRPLTIPKLPSFSTRVLLRVCYIAASF